MSNLFGGFSGFGNMGGGFPSMTGKFPTGAGTNVNINTIDPTQLQQFEEYKRQLEGFNKVPIPQNNVNTANQVSTTDMLYNYIRDVYGIPKEDFDMGFEVYAEVIKKREVNKKQLIQEQIEKRLYGVPNNTNQQTVQQEVSNNVEKVEENKNQEVTRFRGGEQK